LEREDGRSALGVSDQEVLDLFIVATVFANFVLVFVFVTITFLFMVNASHVLGSYGLFELLQVRNVLKAALGCTVLQQGLLLRFFFIVALFVLHGLDGAVKFHVSSSRPLSLQELPLLPGADASIV